MIDEATARRRLRYTWHAFLGRFGRLTDTQRVAIEPIADGDSVVLCAPTASGKTEAIVAPLIERYFEPGQTVPGVRILVVCPTRALCNDLHRRTRRPIADCGWSSDIKTGDSPRLSADEPPHVVVTTPESFDSLLSRQPATLKEVDALMLDELHLVDGGPRGDHLLALTHRLRSFRPDLQVCAASATAADSRRLADDYAGPDARVVTAGGNRDRRLQLRLQPAATLPQAAATIADAVDTDPGSKMLVFCNTRAEVEWLSANLDVPRVFAHHGSLAKAERERTERAFLSAPSGACVATMTLELGVDIGDVDRVVLINPPPNVASFTQRVGRSNRREEMIRAIGLYSTSFDRQRFEHMVKCAEDGRLFVERIAFRPTVLTQQAISLAFQNPKGWVSAAALHDRLPPVVRRAWTQRDCAQILQRMRRKDYLHADSRGRYVADEPAERDYRYGRIHAHIDGDGEVEVVDEATGRLIGTAKWSDDDQPRHSSGGSELLLGGKRRKVTRVRDRRVFVEAGESAEDAQFLSRSGPRYSFELARDLADHLGLGDEELGFQPMSNRHWRVEHFFGTVWGQLLATAMRQHGFRVKSVGPFFAECRLPSGTLPEELGSARHIEEDIRTVLDDRYARFLKPLQAGPWKRFVPDDMLRRWVISCLRPGEFSDQLARFRLVERR